jgi:hypothetical protein
VPDIVKSLIDGLDKLTDILNIGRLLFYTSAGFCAILPVAMCIALLGQEKLSHSYWVQFVSDLETSSRKFEVWFAALIAGFIISVLANAIVKVTRSDPVPTDSIPKDTYTFQYARLYSGGVRLSQGTSKDYAAWLISEYYRYFEIALFIPCGLCISLPGYAIYSLAYSIRIFAVGQAGVLSFAFFAFPFWALASMLAWTTFWPYWVGKVVQDAFSSWRAAKRNAIEGLKQFIDETKPTSAETQPETSKRDP